MSRTRTHPRDSTRAVEYGFDLEGRLVRTVRTVIPTCGHGHDLTRENVRVSGDRWVCVPCEQRRSREMYERRIGGSR